MDFVLPDWIIVLHIISGFIVIISVTPFIMEKICSYVDDETLSFLITVLLAVFVIGYFNIFDWTDPPIKFIEE